MSQNSEKIGSIHYFLRTNKMLYPVRKVYASFLMLKRNGIVFTWKYYNRVKRSRISKNRYYKKLVISPRERRIQQNASYATSLCFSILVPLYNTPEFFLRQMIESVQKQTYSNWQLCLADGSDNKHKYVGDVVNEYRNLDERISYKKLKENKGISSNTNACLQMAEGEFILLYDHDDVLHESALYKIRKAIDEENADFIYTDEAVFSHDFLKPDEYHFKPDYSPYNLRSNNYICHITCFSRELLDKLECPFRSEYDGSQDFDLVLRLTNRANKIVHIPEILYFWRCHDSSVASDISAKTYCINAGKKAVTEHLRDKQANVASSELFPVIYRVNYQLTETPRVSIIIWEGKNDKYTARCVKSIKENTNYTNYEILLCNKNMSRNQCVEKATGKYLLFLENDCICQKDDWLTELLEIIQDTHVGLAGAKILYDNQTIRDAGIVIGIGAYRLAVSRYYRLQADYSGYWGDMYYAHNVSAVSDSCMILRKDDYNTVGGMEDSLPGWFAGLDISLKIRGLGKQIILNPYSEVLFGRKDYERGIDGCYYSDLEHSRYLKKRWAKLLEKGDPYYNVNLTKDTNDYSIGL